MSAALQKGPGHPRNRVIGLMLQKNRAFADVLA
jgi:hypothetical protein